MFDKRHNVPYNNVKGVGMNETRKRKLLNYLYPREEIAEFMISDFYVELTIVLDKKICFSSSNIKNSERAKNLSIAREIVSNFLESNIEYKLKLEEFFPKTDKKVLIDNIICGYVMIISLHINKGSGADVFLDKRSVCYSKISILDLF